MEVPLGIRRKLEKAAKINSDVSRSIATYTNGTADIDLDLHSCARLLSDTLDQIFSDVWSVLNNKTKDAPNKPRLYWTSSQKEVDLDSHLQRSQMPTLRQRYPLVYETLLGGCKTGRYAEVKVLANRRHESDLEVETGMAHTGTSIGHGQTVYIEKLEFRDGRITQLSGWESDGGETRPISVKHRFEPAAVEKVSGKNILTLLETVRTRALSDAKTIYDELAK